MDLRKEGEIDKAGITGNQGWKCPKCKQYVSKRYCSACDEYYNVCGCEPTADDRNDHSSCRY